jgi:hypothetical protein
MIALSRSVEWHARGARCGAVPQPWRAAASGFAESFRAVVVREYPLGTARPASVG